MADDRNEPKDVTPQGLEVPIPTRADFLRNLEKVATPKPKPPEDDRLKAPSEGVAVLVVNGDASQDEVVELAALGFAGLVYVEQVHGRLLPTKKDNPRIAYADPGRAVVANCIDSWGRK